MTDQTWTPWSCDICGKDGKKPVGPEGYCDDHRPYPGGPVSKEDPVAGKLAANEMQQHFAWAHLPDHLAEVSKPFCAAANQLVDSGAPDWAGLLTHILDLPENLMKDASRELAFEALDDLGVMNVTDRLVLLWQAKNAAVCAVLHKSLNS